MSSRLSLFAVVKAAMSVAFGVSFASVPAHAQAVLPAPNPGSFSTAFAFDVLSGRLVAFDGFQTFRQSPSNPDTFNSFGSLPPEFAGGTDPAFMLTSSLGSFYLLGAGAGGAEFPDPAFNGNIFLLPITGGEATLIANVPFHTGATFRGPLEVFLAAGNATFDGFTVNRLSLTTGNVVTVIDAGPGASAGVGAAIDGDIFAGIGFDPDGIRTGEIRKFERQDIRQAINTGVPIPFDAGEFVVQVLSATGLLIDAQGDLWVAGGDAFGTGSFGFVAEVDAETGSILRQINPSGNPNAFFSIAINHRFGCTIGISEGAEVFLVDACE